MASASKKIGYIGPVPECSTGNKHLFSESHSTAQNFQPIHNPFILLSFPYIHYDAVANFRNNFNAFVGHRFWQISTTFGRHATHCASQKCIVQGR